MVSEKLTQEFKTVILEELGTELSDTDARQILDDLTNYLSLLADVAERVQANT